MTLTLVLRSHSVLLSTVWMGSQPLKSWPLPLSCGKQESWPMQTLKDVHQIAKGNSTGCSIELYAGKGLAIFWQTALIGLLKKSVKGQKILPIIISKNMNSYLSSLVCWTLFTFSCMPPARKLTSPRLKGSFPSHPLQPWKRGRSL